MKEDPEWYKKIPCCICGTIGKVQPSKLCNAQFICLGCGQRGFWTDLKNSIKEKI